MALKIGDRVEFPSYGAAKVTAIRTERIGGIDVLSYILESDSEDKTKPIIKLPVKTTGE